MSQNVRLEVRDRVGHVILDRAEKHNAFNEQTIAELTSIFRTIELDPVVRVVVVESEGRSFSAGGDLAWMKKTRDFTEDENMADARALADMLKRLNELPKPTVCKVQGSAFGGGVGLVACCDIAIASENAKFCLSEVKLGLSPATISPYVIHAIGATQARRYFLTAETFSASKACEMGLVHEVTTSEELHQATQTVVNKLLANGPEALAIAKSLVFLTQPMVTPEIQERTARYIAQQRIGAEGQEGLAAFFEKRTASWVTHIDSL